MATESITRQWAKAKVALEGVEEDIAFEAWFERERPRLLSEGRAQARELKPIQERLEHHRRARNAESIATKALASAAGHDERAAGIIKGRELVKLAAADYQGYQQARGAAERERAAGKRYKKLAKQERRAADKVATLKVKEARVYGESSPHSWFADTGIRAANPDSPEAQDATERLSQYGRELRHEMDRGSKEGRRAERILREQTRTEDETQHERRYADLRWRNEARALTTGSGATAAASSNAAAFVSPAFLLKAWAAYRGKYRAFADQCHAADLPAFGMQLYVPRFSSTASASQQTEAAAVSESTPTGALESGEVKTITGEVVISRQLHERGMFGGGSFDEVIFRQILQQLEQEVDVYVLSQAITNGESVTGQTEYKTAKLYQDIALAREKLTDTAGTRLRPTHFFTTSDLYSYATRQVDATTERPIVVPTYAPGFPLSNGADDGLQGDEQRPKWSRFTGTVLPAGVLWFEDDNIPAVGTTNHTQLIVSAPDEAILLAEGEPILTTFAETAAANSLELTVNARKYVAAVTRHAAGTAIISSAAYLTSLV